MKTSNRKAETRSPRTSRATLGNFLFYSFSNQRQFQSLNTKAMRGDCFPERMHPKEDMQIYAMINTERCMGWLDFRQLDTSLSHLGRGLSMKMSPSDWPDAYS